MTPVARSVARPASQGVALLALVGGLFLASAGLIAIRFAQQDGMPTSLIVMLRLSIGALVFTPLTLPRHLPRIRRMPRRALLLLLFAGISLCADLMLFVEAIKYVNILLATIIISLMPLITALMERYLLKAPLQRSMYVGMVLAIGGVLIIAFGSSSGDADLGPNPPLGALLALLSVFSACSYLIISRKLRSRIPLLPYTWMLFGAAAIVSIVIVPAGSRKSGRIFSEGSDVGPVCNCCQSTRGAPGIHLRCWHPVTHADQHCVPVNHPVWQRSGLPVSGADAGRNGTDWRCNHPSPALSSQYTDNVRHERSRRGHDRSHQCGYA